MGRIDKFLQKFGNFVFDSDQQGYLVEGDALCCFQKAMQYQLLDSYSWLIGLILLHHQDQADPNLFVQ
jgi:hypothetical protein